MEILKERLTNTKEAISNLERTLAERNDELQRVVKERNELKSKIMSAHKQIDTLERQIERSELMLNKRLERLAENLAAAAESKRAREYLEKKCAAQEQLMRELEQKAQEVRTATISAQEKFTEAFHRLKEIDDQVDRLEQTNEKKEKSTRELESLCILYANKSKALEASEIAARETVNAMEREIKELGEKLSEATRRAREAEAEAHAHQIELSYLEDELVEWKEKNTSLRSEVGRISGDVQEI